MASEQKPKSREIPPPMGFRPGDSIAIPTHQDILYSDPEEFDSKFTDIGANNLACAAGLPGAEKIDIPKYLALLDKMAASVKQWTEKNWRLFEINPKEFKSSKNVFRAIMLTHVLRRQFGIRYNPARTHIGEDGQETFNFATLGQSDTEDMFIHGALSERRMGICGTLPVVAVAVGRRLGYPLYLVKLPFHLFFRWHDNQERFNIECTPKAGSCVYPDEYYRKWPHYRGEEEGWDKPLSNGSFWLDALPARLEMARFIANRVLELRRCKRFREVLDWVGALERFHGINYDNWRWDAEDALGGVRSDTPKLSQDGPSFADPSSSKALIRSVGNSDTHPAIDLSPQSCDMNCGPDIQNSLNASYYSEQPPLNNPPSPNQVTSPHPPAQKSVPTANPTLPVKTTIAPALLKRIPPLILLAPVPPNSPKFSKLSGVHQTLPTITSFVVFPPK
jgi:hypothetical protein